MSLQPLVDAGPAERVEQAPRPHRYLLVPWLLAAISFAAYAAFSVLQFERLADPSWDLSIFTQVVRNYAHFHAPVANLKGPGFNILGDHFSPIIAAIAPIYRVFPSPLTLQVCQAALFALAVVPITRLAVRQLGQRAGLAVGIAYSLAWGIQTAVAADFHEIAFAVPMLAFALEALVEERWKRAALWSIPLVLVKEDLGLTVAAIGLYLVLRRQRSLGAALVVFGIAATVITMAVIIPALNPRHTYDYLGAGISGGQSSSLGASLRHLVTPVTKLYTVLLLLAASGLVALRSPLLIICVPTLLWRFESGNPAYWGTNHHYSATLMPIVFVALIDGATRLKASSRSWLRASARFGPWLALAAAVVLLTQYPLETLVNGSAYRGAPTSGLEALALVPHGVTVEADDGLMSQLVAHDTVYWRGDTGGVPAEYMVLDKYAGYPTPIRRPVRYAESLHPGTSYKLIFRRKPYYVLQRTSVAPS